MKAVVLAAGKGTRLAPLTDSIPKPMLGVGGKPVIAYVLDMLAGSGVTEVYMNLHHRPQPLRNYCGSGAAWGLRIRYAVETELLGTAGAVRNFGLHLMDGPFLVIYADNFIQSPLEPLLLLHKERGGLATIALYEKEDTTGSGIVQLDDAGRVLRFIEKPTPDQVVSHLVNAGVYVLDPAILPLIPDNVPCDFGFHVFPALLASGYRIYGRVMEGTVWPIDTPDLYRRVQQRMGDEPA